LSLTQDEKLSLVYGELRLCPQTRLTASRGTGRRCVEAHSLGAGAPFGSGAVRPVSRWAPAAPDGICFERLGGV